ncbi:MAG: hypothetical protein U5L98_04970 [Halomonas sp.]|uniref:hypothetical protein n=1 Tax=Halomonas sp. TaxID=1486246 RepID=UPI002ACEEE62|nr:hypothetical protein [Halomonas sp.]MDZ7852005.1 hypothetical protein [Halomonas sp.]
MNATLPYLFRGEIPTPKRQPKRPGQSWPRLPLPRLMSWAPWVLLGVVVYGVMLWPIERLAPPALPTHLLALVGVITAAACLEIGSWLLNGKRPLALMLPMALGGLIAMLIALL